MSEERSVIMYTRFILNTGKVESTILVCMILLYDSCNNFFSRLITVGSKNQELTQLTCYIFTAHPYYIITLYFTKLNQILFIFSSSSLLIYEWVLYYHPKKLKVIILWTLSKGGGGEIQSQHRDCFLTQSPHSRL